MKKVIKIEPGCYYMFESLSSARSCYFENKNEIFLFRQLFKRYLGDYIHVHKMYMSCEGYQILLRLKRKESLRDRYAKECKKKGKSKKQEFLESPWRIVSERVRLFHSLYVKAVNRMRGRKGVLVQERYNRYVFDGLGEYERYLNEMEKGKEMKGQENEKYRVRVGKRKSVNRVVLGWVFGLGRFVVREFQDLVVANLINQTISHHFHLNSP